MDPYIFEIYLPIYGKSPYMGPYHMVNTSISPSISNIYFGGPEFRYGGGEYNIELLNVMMGSSRFKKGVMSLRRVLSWEKY